MKILLFISGIIIVVGLLFLYLNSDFISRDSNTIEQTDISERCAEFDNKDEDYNFSYGDRIRQIFKGCF